MKSIVLLLFVSKAFSFTQITKSSNEHNVTNTSNDTSFGKLQTVEPENVGKLFDSLVYLDPANDHATTPYKYNFTWLWNLGKEEEITFCNIRLAHASYNNSRVSYGFLDNRMLLHSGQFHVNLSGDMILHEDLEGYFEAVAYFNGFTIGAIRHQPNTNGNSFLIEDVQYDQVDITCKGKLNFPSGRTNLKHILPSILRTHMNRNKNFQHALDEMYDKYAASSSIQTTKLSNDDYTNVLNDTIVGIFQTAEPQNIAKLIEKLEYSDWVHDIRSTPYEYNHTCITGESHILRFPNIRLTYASSNNSRASIGFLKNEIQIYCPQLIVKLTGTMNLTGTEHDNIFYSTMNFNGYTITAIRQPKISDNSWLIDLHHDDLADIKFEIPGYPELPVFRSWLREELLENRKRVLLPILHTHISRNKKLMQAFSELFDTHFNNHFISKHPHFTGHELIYYLIPNIPIGYINLKDIVVRGLWNYHSLKFTTDNNVVTYRLLINNIRGNMILEDAAGAAMSRLQLHYYIDLLSIFVTQEINRISVKAENYFIIETKSNTSLTKLQSDIMMDQVERAFGSSLMPSMEYQSISRSNIFPDKDELKTIIRQILTEKLAHSNKPTVDTKNLHKNLTLLDDSTYTTNQIRSKEEKITNINNNYHYHISLQDVNINLLSGNPEYSDKTLCAPPISSEFTHRINVSASGKTSSKTNEADIIGVTFHFKYPSVNLSSTKSRNYEKNDSCEFQIRNNRDIQIKLSPSTNITGSNERHKIQKRIDATLMSMTKDRIIHTLKPIVCSPFDVCRRTANMIDDYFLKFVDIVLKKCSLRKNNPVT